MPCLVVNYTISSTENLNNHNFNIKWILGPTNLTLSPPETSKDSSQTTTSLPILVVFHTKEECLTITCCIPSTSFIILVTHAWTSNIWVLNFHPLCQMNGETNIIPVTTSLCIRVITHSMNLHVSLLDAKEKKGLEVINLESDDEAPPALLAPNRHPTTFPKNQS